MRQEEIRFMSDGLKLGGKLALPDGTPPWPAVLLIPGSGPVDRNENAGRMKINAFYEIAASLAEHGFASLRYDKRGVGASQGEWISTGFDEGVGDAVEALRFLRARSRVVADRVFVLGHSEGAVISTRMAAEDPSLAGVVLVAGSAKSGEATRRWQAVQVAQGMTGLNGWLIRALHIDVVKAQQKALDKIKASKKDWYRQQLIAKVNAKWFREFLAYDPAVDLARITIPLLAITGSKDIQVDPADLERMGSLVKGPFESHEIPNMTHMLRLEAGPASIQRYRDEIREPVEPPLLRIINDWLARQPARPEMAAPPALVNSPSGPT